MLIKKKMHTNCLRLRHHVGLPLTLGARKAVLGAASIDCRTVPPIKDHRCLNGFLWQFVIFRDLRDISIRALELRHDHPYRHICRSDARLIDAGFCGIEMNIAIKQPLLMP